MASLATELEVWKVDHPECKYEEAFKDDCGKMDVRQGVQVEARQEEEDRTPENVIAGLVEFYKSNSLVDAERDWIPEWTRNHNTTNGTVVRKVEGVPIVGQASDNKTTEDPKDDECGEAETSDPETSDGEGDEWEAWDKEKPGEEYC